MQALGQGLVDHHAVPVGFLGEELLAHEVDLLVAGVAFVEHRTVGADHRTFDSLGIGLFVGGEKVLPKRCFRYLVGRNAHLGNMLLVQRAEAQQRVGDLLLDLLVVVVVAADDLHAQVLAMLVDPQPEPCEGRRDGRHRECHRFERRIAPRFVVGREDRDVHTDEQFVIILVEDAVGLVQVGRHEDHLHLRIVGREDAAVQGVHDRVAVLVFEVVGRILVLSAVDRAGRVGQVRLQVRARAAVAGRNGDVGQNLAFEAVGSGQFLERFDEYVEALVAEFVAAAGADDQRFLPELVPEAGLGHRDHCRAGFGTLGVVLLARPYKVVFEPVGRDAVRFASQQVFAFVGRDVADREEGVVVRGGHLLDRVFGHYVEPPCQFVGIELGQVVVERQAVTGDAAPHDRGVRREERGHIGGVFAQVESACSSHPLVEMRGDLVRRIAEIVDIRGDDHARGIAEEHGFDVIPLSRERIHVVRLPEFLEYFVLAGDQRSEVHQDHRRLALDLPVPHADPEPVAVYALAPCFQHVGVFLEFGVRPLVLEVGPDEDIAVGEFPGCGLCFGRDDGMDAADLVADLPAHLEKVVGSQFCITHICRACL